MFSRVMAIRGVVGLLLIAATWAAEVNAELLLSAPTLSGMLPVHSWKERRDERVVKQDLDYSCGAAALATILQSFYDHKITEDVLLKAMGNADAASFADMARVLPQFGFKAVGVTMGFEQLRKLKIPVVVYLRHYDQDHFSVLRGIGNGLVWLADPSWGNRRLSEARFLSMWEAQDASAIGGKALLVLPLAQTYTKTDFFGEPSGVNLPVEMLSIRAF